MILSDNERQKYLSRVAHAVKKPELTEDTIAVIDTPPGLEDNLDEGFSKNPYQPDPHTSNGYLKQFPYNGTTNPTNMDEYIVKMTAQTFGRADFYPEQFDRLVWQKGFTAIWEQAIFCSCIDRKTGQPDYNCDSCNGLGYTYINPRFTKIVATSINGKQEHDKHGLEDKGSIYLTNLSVDVFGFRDRVTFPEFVMRHTEILEVGKRATCRYLIKELLGVYIKDKKYELGKDFTIENNNTIVWTNTDILGGTRFSIVYMTNPRYIIMVPIHELRGTYVMYDGGGKDYFVRLPSQFQAKREDYLYDRGILNPLSGTVGV